MKTSWAPQVDRLLIVSSCGPSVRIFVRGLLVCARVVDRFERANELTAYVRIVRQISSFSATCYHVPIAFALGARAFLRRGTASIDLRNAVGRLIICVG